MKSTLSITLMVVLLTIPLAAAEPFPITHAIPMEAARLAASSSAPAPAPHPIPPRLRRTLIAAGIGAGIGAAAWGVAARGCTINCGTFSVFIPMGAAVGGVVGAATGGDNKKKAAIGLAVGFGAAVASIFILCRGTCGG